MKLPIYLDYNATTPVAPEVADAMQPLLREAFGNPSSSHYDLVIFS
jgi:cysteine desulfurase